LFFSFLVGVCREYWPSPLSSFSWWFFFECFVELFSVFWQFSEAEFLGRLFSSAGECDAELDFVWFSFFAFVALTRRFWFEPPEWQFELGGLLPAELLWLFIDELVTWAFGAALEWEFAAPLEFAASTELCTGGALELAPEVELVELAKHSRNQHAIDSSQR
jgi:hypothetical protein